MQMEDDIKAQGDENINKERLHIYSRGVFRCGVWPVTRSYLPMSNVVTHSAQRCKYFIKIIYNPFRRILHKRRMG